MLVSITPLGSARMDARGAAIQVMQYVQAKIDAGKRGARSATGAVEGYYADSVEGAGRWTGAGIDDLSLTGAVTSDQLQRVLVGEHPVTGQPLSTSRPMARRAGADVDERVSTLTLAQAARVAGVSTRHLRRIAVSAAPKARDASATYLVARRDGRRWLVEREELDRFMSARRPAREIIGYDITFSCPKSVSILWATGSPAEREAIVASVDAAVDAGLRYLESVTTVRDRDRSVSTGLVSAAFTHGTSRNLDPQLHVHAITSKLARTPRGEVRPLQGKDLYAHATTAGYLAGAELRHQLAQRLGLQWGAVRRGLADIEGVPTSAIRAMSTRRAQIETLASEMGVHSPAARSVAAYRTRAPKTAVDPVELKSEWEGRLAAVGFDDVARRACLGRAEGAARWDAADRTRLDAHLRSPQGVTEQQAVFDRRDVIQTVVEWTGDRLDAAAVLSAADAFLESGPVVPLRAENRSMGILYSTQTMLAAEQAVLGRFEAGIDQGFAVVSTDALDVALTSRPSLGDDQIAMVRAICTSGDQFQCVVGPAGSGKTFALDAARDAWQRAGFHVVGAADQGSAAETLGRGAGVRSETLEYWLTVLDHHPEPATVLGPRTVMIVDEASTVGTRSLARLVEHAQRNGATVRLVGDPAQHTAVTAGGAFNALVVRHADRTPTLTEARRQSGMELGEVRLALEEFREGLVRDALDRLVRDDRVVLADSAGELLDKLVADWWVDREHARHDPTVIGSSMVAEQHRERAELNSRARSLLAASGELHGPALSVGGQEFRAGDEVISRAAAKHLSPPGQPAAYIRNGTRGMVVAVHGLDDVGGAGLTVQFDRRAPIRVPLDFLEREIRPGVVGGLTHSYALTSHAAQGLTFQAGRTLATDVSSRPGVYVGLTRGRDDARLYAVRRRDLAEDSVSADHMPRIEEERTALQAIADRLDRERREGLATNFLQPHMDVARTPEHSGPSLGR